MRIVAYVPLIDEGSQTLVAKSPAPPASAPTGNLAVPTAVMRGLNGQARPAIILSTSEANGVQYANLVVFTDFGDPFRGATPDASVRLARVPYSEAREPGTFHVREEIRLGPAKAAAAAEWAEAGGSYTIDKVPLPDLTIEQLRSHAVAFGVDLGSARSKPDIIKAFEARFSRA